MTLDLSAAQRREIQNLRALAPHVPCVVIGNGTSPYSSGLRVLSSPKREKSRSAVQSSSTRC